MTVPMDSIEIDNLRLRCIIGFSPHERKDKQDVVISLRIRTDMHRSGETDHPDDTFNYRTVTKAIIAHVEASTYNLVEKLAAEVKKIGYQSPTSWHRLLPSRIAASGACFCAITTS